MEYKVMIHQSLKKSAIFMCPHALFLQARSQMVLVSLAAEIALFPASIKTHECVVRPKKPERHTVSILTGRKKTQFSHLCSSVIPYPIGTKFAREVPPSLGSLHTKFEENRSNHFRDTSEQNFVLISWLFPSSSSFSSSSFRTLGKIRHKHECVLGLG